MVCLSRNINATPPSKIRHQFYIPAVPAGTMKKLTLLLVLVLVSSAYAAPMSAPRIHLKDGTSTNWAGYAVETSLAKPQSAVTDVKGSWTVPAADCSVTPTAYSSFWIGIDGYSSNTVEQIGTDSDCSSGKPQYYAWYEMYPKFPSNLRMTVKPGDVMTAEVKYNANGKFLLTITDTTTGASFSTTQNGKSAKRSSAEWIAEAPSSGGVLPLADFGTAQFQGASATLNGHTGTISDTSWQKDALTMATSSGVTKALPSSLSPDGSAFSVTWQHS